MGVRVIGAPFNSAGTADGVAAAPAALRRAGLVERVGGRDAGDLTIDGLTPERSVRSGLKAEWALVALVERCRAAVRAAHSDGQFPLLVGGDCAVLLGALAATRDRWGGTGLVMADGHEDGYPPHRSLTGEAADCELYLALGLPAEGLPAALAELLPLVAPRQVALIGPRDDAVIARDGVPSLRGTVPMVTDVEVVVRGPAAVAAAAAAEVAATAPAWWLHTDLDVLATDQLAAVDYPQPGGLSWDQLALLTKAALATSGCAGWTVTIYNPDLDPDGRQAGRVVDYLAAMSEHLPSGPPGPPA
jgi:arginase